jgi:hypothetical protein
MMPMRDYPFTERLARGRYYTVVEVAVDSGIPDILDFVVSADYMTFEGRSIRRLQNVTRRRVMSASPA